MFDRFTDHAKRVMSFARQEAQKLDHEYIGTEHILLGLVREEAGVAAGLLVNMEIDLERIRREVEKIGAEHLLLSLVREGSGGAANVLKDMGIDLEEIRHEVEKIVKKGPPQGTMGQLPFTPRAKKVLELSMEEASALGHDYIGTRHLLLGLIQEEAGVAARVLRGLGVQFGEARAAVEGLRRDGTAGEETNGEEDRS